MSTSNIIPLPPTLTPTNGKKHACCFGYVLTDDIILNVARKYEIRVRTDPNGTVNISRTRSEVITVVPAKLEVPVGLTHLKDSTGFRTIPIWFIASDLEPGKATHERAQKFKDAMGMPDDPQWFFVF
ncbi:hypothetical protein BJ138DRAFT_1115390 [Hygrophoropsis aurantiaca]|uniref:Uncharacterized protein n=1 Tax=Hygrophoropsis aurantiaca TaxID=72124 RepID=A0ACB8A6U5_9AGAM|nr:hypothetical protein BJ138DRAFT_1115390 [Hygrophoropsis aurantiaca]